MDRLQVSGGVTEVHDGLLPHAVTTLFRITGPAELRFLISDPSWDYFFDLAEGVIPTFSGDLVLDLAATIDPEELEGQTLSLFDWDEGVQPSSQFDRVIVPGRIEFDMSRLYSTGEVVVQSVLAEPILNGDFDGNGVMDAGDIDALSAVFQRLRQIRIMTWTQMGK